MGEHSQSVKARQQGIDHLGRRLFLPLANGVQHRLHTVRQAGHFFVADGRGRAFQRVRRPEDLLDQLRVRFSLKLHKAGVEEFELLVSLFAKQLDVVVVQVELEAVAFGHAGSTPLVIVRDPDPGPRVRFGTKPR